MYNNLSKFVQVVVFATIIFVPTISANVLSPLPNEVAKRWNDLELVGQTSLKRFGFHIYDASFWMVSNRTDESFSTTLCALSITYEKNIRAEKLLSRTKKEWKKLGIAGEHPIDEWLSELRTIWPDIKKGDQLVIVFDPDGNSTFFSKNKALGSIQNAEFGPAFLSIWLDKNASFKKNRNELLGKT